MDVHRARVIRRVPLVEPKGIREPGVRLRQSDQFSGALVSLMHGFPLVAFENARHTLEAGQNVPNARTVGVVGDVDVSELMIADGEGTAG